MKFVDLGAEVSDEMVLKSLNCRPVSTAYEKFNQELSGLRSDLEKRLRPEGAFAFGKLPEELAGLTEDALCEVLCVILTLGNEISDYCTELFRQGDYVKGMLADSYADAYLFELEKCWTEQVVGACRERGLGIARRLEIPEDLPMEAQKFALEAIGREDLPGVELTSGFMFRPVKTICHIFVLSGETQEYHTEHDCRRCSSTHCHTRKVRPVRVTVHSGGGVLKAVCRGEQKLLEAFVEAGIAVSAVCGGRGSCGKCRVRLLRGEIEVSSQDRAVFSEKELKEGWRLACHAYPLTDCEVELPGGEQEFQILAEEGEVPEGHVPGGTGRDADGKDMRAPGGTERTAAETYGIAADIGTTTLAAQLVECSSGQVLATEVSVNHQRSFGADVLSRIQASNEGKKEALQKSIQKDLWELFERLLRKSGLSGEKISRICLAGNTTMEHLLLGYSCRELGQLPFRPVTLTPPVGTVEEILGAGYGRDGGGKRDPFLASQTPVEFLPGISAFVGADITAGLLNCGFDREEGCSLLLDLGTNGEMALGGKEKLYVTATAAGPAFEGGCISWGVGSVPGAVCRVRINENLQAECETIGGKPPVGICGTGLIEAAAELLRCGLMDETGRLELENLDLEGLGLESGEAGFPLAKTASGETIVLTQKDIRELQLAKAAVRAGMEILLKTAGVEYGDIRQVWLAGGFGYFTDWSKAAAIGLIPKELLGKLRIAGNASLAGTRLALTRADARGRLERIRNVAVEVNLGGRKDFQDAYMDAMFFE